VDNKEKYKQLIIVRTEINDEMDKVMSNIEEKVLDCNLFLREAKKYIASEDKVT